MRSWLCVLLYALAPSSNAMPAQRTVAVTGATGNLGRAAVQILAQRGVNVRALARHQATPDTKPSLAADASKAQVLKQLAALPGVELIPGDVTDRASLNALLHSADAVLACHGARRNRRLSDVFHDPSDEPTHSKQVNYVGVQNLIDAAQASGTCKRIVRVTGKGEAPWSLFSILINLFGSMAKAWNNEGERLLRDSAVDYTIVRPGVMGRLEEQPPASLALADNGGDLKVSAITHSAVAELCVASLDAPNAARATLCAMSVPEGEGAQSWEPLLAKVRPDSRVFRTDLLQEHFRAVRLGGAALIAGVAAFASAVAAVFALAFKALLAAALYAATALQTRML